MTNLPISKLALTFNTDYRSIVDAHFMRHVLDRDPLVVEGDSWITRAGRNDVPGEIIARASYFHSAQHECLVQLDSAVAHLILSERSLVARVAGSDQDACAHALAEIRGAMPEVQGADQEAPVRFWWWQPNVAQEMARMMPAPSWPEIAQNYGASTEAAVQGLASWGDGPPAGGRLLLLHGPPGTGKTTALRALAWEWRRWAEFQFITDPDEFLSNSAYLLSTITESRRSPIASSPVNSWRVLVLEDSGEYLAPDAKHVEGQALSRLLNVCDGVLGEATRSLVVVTSNEPVKSLHPALSRPGRCLAEVEFSLLAREEIERWCAGNQMRPPDAHQAPLAELFAHLEGRRVPEKRPTSFGFSAAA